MAKIVWTPENSEMGLGAVVMERPLKPLTLAEYRSDLDARITRMVCRAGLERASELLSATVEAAEPLPVAQRPLDAAELMVEDSEILVERSGMLGEDWPIPPEKIKPDPELTVEMVEETDLEDWLGTLYHGIL